MTHYCETSDIGSRLGLDSGQRTRAETRLENCIRRASIEIDQCFLDYGRDEPSAATVEDTLDGAIAVDTTKELALTSVITQVTVGSNAQTISSPSFSIEV